jgi:hypothetical protein
MEPHRERRTIIIVDDEHAEAIKNLFMVCEGRAYSFHLKGKQWRFDSDQLVTSRAGESRRVVLQEVLGEESSAHKLDDVERILRGQWS